MEFPGWELTKTSIWVYKKSLAMTPNYGSPSITSLAIPLTTIPMAGKGISTKQNLSSREGSLMYHISSVSGMKSLKIKEIGLPDLMILKTE